jgi:membrane protein
MAGWTSAVDRVQRRHPATGFPLAVIYKYVDDQGSYLAALMTYYGFLSLFPLLLLLSSILGFVLRGDPSAQRSLLHSALGQFPVIGTDLSHPKQLGGHVAGLTIGILASLYGGLGVTQATQNAMNVAWAVPRNNRPNPILSRVRSMLLLLTVGVAILATTVLTALSSDASAFGASVGMGLRVVLFLTSIVINATVFTIAFRVATARPLGNRDVLAGALTAAIAWQLLQSFGAAYVGHVVKNASATDGVFAVVLGLIAFIYLEAMTIVLSVEINVVRVKHLYPRALLTPFTDDVDLTSGDERTYRDSAKAQRNKGFEDVDVTFHAHDRR